MSQPTVKDVRVEVRVRNNLILKKMEHYGFKSVAELSRGMELTLKELSELRDLVNMKKAARDEKGKWLPFVYKLADFFDCMPGDIFSEFQQEVALEKNRSQAELTYTEISRLTARSEGDITPELELQARQLRAAVTSALQKLTPREERVLRLRFGFDGEDLTFEQIGNMFGVSRERIREIEAKAIRKLRHPANTKMILAATGSLVQKSRYSEDTYKTVDLNATKALR